MTSLGVAHKIPCDALITAKDSYDPKECGVEDDTIEDVDINGDNVQLLRDWTKPPVALRCECQKRCELCKCGRGAKPSGVSLKLHWDKVNNMNRYVYTVLNNE